MNPQVGRVFASPALLSHLTAAQNIALPWVVDGVGVNGHYVQQLARAFLVEDALQELPSSLSLDEQYSVAFVRALAGKPAAVTLSSDLDVSPGSSLGSLAQIATQFGPPIEFEDGKAWGAGDWEDAEHVLPGSLDEIAPPPRLSPAQEELVDEAQQILLRLPGPVLDNDALSGEFL